MLRKFVAAVVLLALSAPAASAPPKGRQFIILGVGTTSCGKWTKERRATSLLAEVYSGWVQGYFSSFNEWGGVAEPNILEGTDIFGVEALMDNYCAAHPLDSIAVAAEYALGQAMLKLFKDEEH